MNGGCEQCGTIINNGQYITYNACRDDLLAPSANDNTV